MGWASAMRMRSGGERVVNRMVSAYPARELAISEGTVKIHLHKTYEKLGMNRTSLAVLMRTAEGPTRTYSG
jgi:DNA-binding CsgD family transcriptional regulator